MVPLGLSALNAGICTGIQQTAQKVQAEEIDGFSAYGELLGAGIMLKVVDEALVQAELMEDQLDLQEQIEADVNAMRSIAASWINEETTSADVLIALEDTCPVITTTFEQVTKAAADDGLTPEAMAQIMDEMRQAMEASFEAEGQ